MKQSVPTPQWVILFSYRMNRPAGLKKNGHSADVVCDIGMIVITKIDAAGMTVSKGGLDHGSGLFAGCSAASETKDATFLQPRSPAMA
jgi:hypothetical protein